MSRLFRIYYDFSQRMLCLQDLVTDMIFSSKVDLGDSKLFYTVDDNLVMTCPKTRGFEIREAVDLNTGFKELCVYKEDADQNPFLVVLDFKCQRLKNGDIIVYKLLLDYHPEITPKLALEIY
jgi:hypothetical protein